MQKRIFIFLFFLFTFLSYSTFAEAALQFLPRYQGGYGVRSQDGGRDKVKLSCESFGGYAKQAGQSCSGMFSRGGLTCYKECFCDTSTYQYTTASHQGTGKLCASLSGVCNDKNGAHYANCTLNTCNNRNSTWIGENSKASYTSNNYSCTSQNTSGLDGTCYVCACPASWASGSCPANAASCSTCKAVSPYTTNKFNLVSCKAGYYKNGNSCTQCPAGYKCDGINKTQCPGGSYAAAGASTCSQCFAGQYSSAGASSCLLCAMGSYSTAGSTSCSKCSAGTYSAAGASSCTSCSDGKYSTAGSSSCISCSPRKSNSTHTGCVDCTVDADCTLRTGGSCSGGTCKYPVISCNSTTDRTNEKSGCGATVAGYQCSSCTSQAANGTQTSGQFNCSCAAKTMFPNGSAGSGSNGRLMAGANYGIDTLCDGWHIVCPNVKCQAGYYYTGGGCKACTGNTYSAAKATSCTECPSGQKVNSSHTGCENPCDSVTAVSVPANAHCSSYHSSCSSKCAAWACNSGYTQSGSSCVALKPSCYEYKQTHDGVVSYDQMLMVLGTSGSPSIVSHQKIDENGGYVEVDVLGESVTVSTCNLAPTSDICYVCKCDYTACNRIMEESCRVDGGSYYGYDSWVDCADYVVQMECDESIWYQCAFYLNSY